MPLLLEFTCPPLLTLLTPPQPRSITFVNGDMLSAEESMVVQPLLLDMALGACAVICRPYPPSHANSLFSPSKTLPCWWAAPAAPIDGPHTHTSLGATVLGGHFDAAHAQARSSWQQMDMPCPKTLAECETWVQLHAAPAPDLWTAL